MNFDNCNYTWFPFFPRSVSLWYCNHWIYAQSPWTFEETCFCRGKISNRPYIRIYEWINNGIPIQILLLWLHRWQLSVVTAVYIITVSVSQIGNSLSGKKASSYKQTRCLMDWLAWRLKRVTWINQRISMADSHNVFVFGQWAFVESGLLTG